MLFGLLSKVVGAIYRIPLTSVIGAEGMGLYQMVFPLYTLMLTISSSGLPSSISKLISENLAKNNYKQANKIMCVSFLLLICFSLVCSLLVFLLSGVFANIQGNINAKICYLGLAPAIIFVGLISGFRGYFQGLNSMTPSALSGFFEQIFKLGFGLYFAKLLIGRGVSYGVLGALIGISLSELIASMYLFVTYIIVRNKQKKLNLVSKGEVLSTKKTAFRILSLSLFVSLGGLIMPLTMLIDSSIIINILKAIGLSTSKATSLFGLQTGTVGSIINMPVVLSLGVATAILPCVSSAKAKGDMTLVTKSASKAILMTLIFALPAAVGCYTFSEPIIRLLYSRSLSSEEILIASKILEVASVTIFYLALVQVSSGLLQGLGRFYVPVISLACGAVVKIILNLLLVRVPSINILGAEVSSAMCYFVALLINLSVLIKHGVVKLNFKIFLIFISSFAIYFSRYIFEFLKRANINYFVSFLVTVVFVVAIYFVVLYIFYHKQIFTRKKN